ncbi:YqcC family protein [Alcanivorax sp. 1008]|uniref:YqcC family protein n=1 Tax=Alcanivorax sp. 1008 TaxID=2816853 RepID=UPI001D40275A|nr:YqcC family protein [Alcanivorax sp. 1008]MCC1496925.1 YqcC family protein [Alcanivorax sp. 1008]
MTDPRAPTVSVLLDDIEIELRNLGVWSGQPPSPEAFASNVPFFADRMNFDEWLQWVLLPRFRALIEGALPLPERCQIAPMAEESLKHIEQDTQAIIDLLHQLDGVFSSAL